MASRDEIALEITPEVLLKAYACGIFPMAEAADDPVLYWIEPERRGILPLDRLHIPTRLKRTIKQDTFEVRIDSDFHAVIAGCAAEQPDRETTWINDKIRSLCGQLFEMGYCHTIETWKDGKLVGGLYGVSLGGAFFGESMFSTERDASKVALAHLCARLIFGGYRMLDCQFVTEHLRQFGTIEITRPVFHTHLERALDVTGQFHRLPHGTRGAEALAIVAAAQQPHA